MLVILTTDEMAFLVEVVGDVGMDTGEFLQCLHSPEPEHAPSRCEDDIMPATEAFRHYRIPITGTLNRSASSDPMTAATYEIVKSQSRVGLDKSVSERIPHMPDGDKLEIKIPIPWSSGWVLSVRCELVSG